MTIPIEFISTSPRFSLPYLFVGQAQKEVFVNEALARIDTLLHPSVEGEADAPPAQSVDGQSWIVGMAPTGEWLGHPGELAMRQAGNWLFAAARTGMQVYDSSSGQMARFDGQWARGADIPLPSGGATVDAEARAAIAQLVEALRFARILPDN